MNTLSKINQFNFFENHNSLNLIWENTLWHKLRYAALKDMVLQYNPENLMDIGCGRGILEYLLPDRIQCVGYDLSEEVLSAARELNKSKKNRTFELRNVEEVKLSKNFDAVVMTEVLEHLYDDKKMLETIRGLLVDDGLLIMTVPNEKTLINRLTTLLGGTPRLQHHSHEREYSLPGLTELLNRCGFKVLKANGIYLQLPKENFVPSQIRFFASYYVDNFAVNFPSMATSLLMVAKKVDVVES